MRKSALISQYQIQFWYDRSNRKIFKGQKVECISRKWHWSEISVSRLELTALSWVPKYLPIGFKRRGAMHIEAPPESSTVNLCSSANICELRHMFSPSCIFPTFFFMKKGNYRQRDPSLRDYVPFKVAKFFYSIDFSRSCSEYLEFFTPISINTEIILYSSFAKLG